MINQIFQFISANHSSLEKILSGGTDPHVMLIADLEDSIQDVMRPEYSSQLKRAARLYSLSIFNQQKQQDYTIGFRVNSIHGNEFKEDLRFLSRASECISIDSIVVPKIDSRKDINEYFRALDEYGIEFGELIPIVESVEAIRNMSDIFSAPSTRRFHRALWGHHDYNLDAGNFPFIEYRSKKYWELTRQIVSKLEDSGYSFGCGAFPELGNAGFLEKVVKGIQYMCKKDFDVVALNYGQVELFTSLPGSESIHYETFIDHRDINEEQKILLAKNMVRIFNENRLPGRSFAIDPGRNEIITPQQYLAAMKFLEKIVVE